MNMWDLGRQGKTLENALKRNVQDFAGTYLTVCDLLRLIRTRPNVINSETIQALEGVLTSSEFSDQTQSFFLYREAANALTSVILQSASERLADEAICALTNVLGTTGGQAHRAAAGAFGSLPIAIRGPKLINEAVADVPRVTWQELLKEQGVFDPESQLLVGRSLVVDTGTENKLFVVKLACSQRSIHDLCQEAVWMDHLYSGGYAFPLRFDIPMAIKIEGRHVFRLANVPGRMPEGLNLHSGVYAIGFIAHREYFVYPNEHRTERQLNAEGFRETMFRNAWLLGKLTSLGIVHSAPIPLFHNRVQRHRRADHGLYEWPRRGRLDRWLHSCCYPNFGVTGIRDFEHLVVLNGSGRKLYSHIGTQILSLLLVTGSYFRHKDKRRVGLDERCNPIDARDLFDKQFLEELIEGTFRMYYDGFVGTEVARELPLDFDKLSSRMIEEMGVDRHMEEILRVVDQEQMSDEGFRDFLTERGYAEDQLRDLKKGVDDITIYTGPHLGGFNERISLPELIECVETMSALCIVGRYHRENSTQPFR